MNPSLITGFSPIANNGSRVLILGSMPGIASLDAQAYYAHPRNSFWWIMGQLLNFDAAALSYEQRLQQLLANGIGLWDVIHQCQRKGSLDSAIDTKSLVANDFAVLLSECPNLNRVLCNGGKAYQLFQRHVIKQQQISLPTVQLPSTSPAHASMTREAKCAAWKSALFA